MKLHSTLSITALNPTFTRSAHMPIHDILRRAICANPDDMGARSAYADLLMGSDYRLDQVLGNGMKHMLDHPDLKIKMLFPSFSPDSPRDESSLEVVGYDRWLSRFMFTRMAHQLHAMQKYHITGVLFSRGWIEKVMVYTPNPLWIQLEELTANFPIKSVVNEWAEPGSGNSDNISVINPWWWAMKLSNSPNIPLHSQKATIPLALFVRIKDQYGPVPKGWDRTHFRRFHTRESAHQAYSDALVQLTRSNAEKLAWHPMYKG